MDRQTIALICQEGGKLITELIRTRLPKRREPMRPVEVVDVEEHPLEVAKTPTVTEKGEAASIVQDPARVTKSVAVACIPCALGHFSTSTGLLNEIARFKEEGITSNEVLDRVAKIQAEQNALERVDLAPENIQALPPWEKELAEDALRQSRKLRHSLEGFTSIKQLEQLAADTSSFYKKLNRNWFKQRLKNMTTEEKARMSKEAIEKLEEEI